MSMFEHPSLTAGSMFIDSARVLLLSVVVLLGCSSSTTTAPPPANTVASPETGTVTLIIRVDGEVIEKSIENVPKGTTVQQLMSEQTDLDIEITGSGATALLTSMKGKFNFGSEGWTYRVDGKSADRSIGVYELSPPTTVTWKHGDYQDDAE